MAQFVHFWTTTLQKNSKATFLATYLGILFLFTTFSSSTNEITIQLEGKVLDAAQPLPGVRVYVEKGNSADGFSYYEPTTQEGNYHLTFNANSNETVRLTYKKQGFETQVVTYLVKNLQHASQLGIIQLQPSTLLMN